MISHVAFIALNLVSFDWIDSIGEFIHARLAALLILIPHALGTRPPTGSISVQGRPGGDLIKEGRLTSPHSTSPPPPFHTDDRLHAARKVWYHI